MAALLESGDTHYDDQIAEGYEWDDQVPLPAGYPGANSARACVVTDAEFQEFLNGIGDSTRERVEALL